MKQNLSLNTFAFRFKHVSLYITCYECSICKKRNFLPSSFFLNEDQNKNFGPIVFSSNFFVQNQYIYDIKSIFVPQSNDVIIKLLIFLFYIITLSFFFLKMLNANSLELERKLNTTVPSPEKFYLGSDKGKASMMT